MIDLWFALLLAAVVVWQAFGVLAYKALRIVTNRRRNDG